MTLEEKVAQLEQQVAKLKVKSDAASISARFSMPMVTADTYEQLDLMRKGLQPPCMGWVRYCEKQVAKITFDEHNVPTFGSEPRRVLCSRYYVLTYPPPPPLAVIRQPVASEQGVEDHNYGVMGIYQPSAGLAGSMVYFDQDMPYTESCFSVGTPTGNDLWEVKDVQSYQKPGYAPDDPKGKMIHSLSISYKDINMDELMWLEVNLLGPFGQKLLDHYHVLVDRLVKNGVLTYEELNEVQRKLYGTEFNPVYTLPTFDETVENP